MPYIVDFEHVSTTGLESSPVAKTLAGLRANEARYYQNKYKHVFATNPAEKTPEIMAYVNRILKDERGIVLSSKPLETARIRLPDSTITYVFYEDGLVLNVMHALDDAKKSAVGLKLSEGMEVPKELDGKFKFARQRSKLAGVIRGSFFVLKGKAEASWNVDELWYA